MSPSDTIDCPIERAAHTSSCPPEELSPLLEYLQSPDRAAESRVFPRGTITADGRLDLCKQDVGPEGCRLVTDALRHQQHIRSLLLGTDAIGDIGAAAVAELVEHNQHLEIVYLGCNHITAAGAESLAAVLEHAQHVTGLWLKRNPIGDDGVRAIAAMLRKNRGLRTLDLVNTGVGKTGLASLIDALRENSTVRRLYLGGNDLDSDDAATVAELLGQSSSLEALSLSVNRIGDDGACVLAAALRKNSTLCELSLASNGISACGGAVLLDAVAQHPSLSSLDLGFSPSTRALNVLANTLRDEGARAAARMLLENRSLKKLDLHHNDIGPTGLSRLAEAMERNTTLVELSLNGPLPASLKAALARNRASSSDDLCPSSDVALIKSVYRTLPKR